MDLTRIGRHNDGKKRHQDACFWVCEGEGLKRRHKIIDKLSVGRGKRENGRAARAHFLLAKNFSAN
jgi:hypothetical protein